MSERCPECGQFTGDGHVCPTYVYVQSQPSKVKFTGSDDAAVAEIYSDRIVSVEALLALAEVDLDKWYVERYVVNKWEVGSKGPDGDIVVEPLFQVKAWLKPVGPLETVKEIISEQIEEMRSYTPKKPNYNVSFPKKTDRILEFNLPDIHFGMYAWGEEAGQNYNANIARAYVEYVTERIIDEAKRRGDIGKCLVPFGNDWLHIDQAIAGKGGQTNRGTPQDVDTRHRKIFREGRQLGVWMIDRLAEFGQRDVIVIPGNHDLEKMWCVGDSIESWYWNDQSVRVYNDASPRKYYRHGVTLLGFAHGHNERPQDLPLIMARERPEDWGVTWHREWHIGHKHKMKGDEYNGVRVRVIPSISPNDNWHNEKGYYHMQYAEAYIWDAQEGYCGTISVSIPDEFRMKVEEL